ncbi:DMT family transporter [Tibeticola sp.]|uniref:DMT family transporter n=1 Tax=Tibeticola sp. TaxID=2005368 RepID=UPI00258D21D0|nr:DMT family transporter [Tibeticola sp.]
MNAAESTATPWVPELVLLAAIWGSSFLFMQTAAAAFGPLPTAALRVTIAGAVLAPFLLRPGQAAALRQAWRPIFLVGLLNSGLPFVLYAWALQFITTGLSAILNATVPLFGALIAWIWLGDRLTATRVLGLALGFAGVVLLAADKAGMRHGDLSETKNQLAIAACLGATLCYGISASYTRRHLARVPPLATAAGSQIGAALALALPAALSWPAQTPGPLPWLAAVTVGILCSGLAYVLFFRLIQHAGPTRALAVTFIVPLFALLYGNLFLGEQITPWMLACGAVVLLGTALSTGLLQRLE